MYIRVMRMPVHERLMSVLMRVRGTPIPLEGMLMLMMRIVAMSMRVGQRFVSVLVLVHLGEVQPDSGGHQRRREPELPRDRLSECDDGDCSTDERRGAEIGAGAR